MFEKIINKLSNQEISSLIEENQNLGDKIFGQNLAITLWEAIETRIAGTAFSAHEMSLLKQGRSTKAIENFMARNHVSWIVAQDRIAHFSKTGE